MGDNRRASFDSRRFGPVGTDTIVGRAFLKVWPLGDIGFL
jgi:type IV secretory pathway protease TraF